MSIRSVATYIEAVTRLLFVFGCTERRAQVVRAEVVYRRAAQGPGKALGVLPVIAAESGTRLAQVFFNLLNNATKYTEPGGSISLTGKLSGSEVVVRVRDNGMFAFPSTPSLPGIFEVFSRVNRSMERAQSG